MASLECLRGRHRGYPIHRGPGAEPFWGLFHQRGDHRLPILDSNLSEGTTSHYSSDQPSCSAQEAKDNGFREDGNSRRQPLAQYVSDQPTTVIVSTSNSIPVLTMLKVLPWPSR